MRVSKSADGMIKPKADAEPIGQGIRVKCVKNKTAPPFRQAEFKVYFDGRETSEIDEIADIALSKGLIPKYNSAGELCPTGRQYRWADEPKFLAKSKAEVSEQLKKFPNVAEALKEIIVSGKFDESAVDYDGEGADSLDSDYDDDDFEAMMKEEAESIESGSEAEEIETDFDM